MYVGELFDAHGLMLGGTRESLTISSCSQLPRLSQHWFTDAGQVATPGYKLPSSVVGFELRGERGGVGEGEELPPPIELGFYRRTTAGGMPVVSRRPIRAAS
ncbi:MAG: hypothetical protein SGPRY_000006 [Prymnesium sp.]